MTTDDRYPWMTSVGSNVYVAVKAWPFLCVTRYRWSFIVQMQRVSSKKEYSVPTVIVYFLHGLKRWSELIRQIKKKLVGTSHACIFPPIITWTRHGLLEIFSCARREGLAQELFRRFGEQQCDKSDSPIIIAFGTRKYSLYLWRLLTKSVLVLVTPITYLICTEHFHMNTCSITGSFTNMYLR